MTTHQKLKFPCVTFEQAGKTLVLFHCTAKILWSIAEVNQRKEDGVKGYQRALSLPRVGKIAQFIDANNYIPTSVLISFSHAKLSRDKTQLTVDNRPDAGWVIDGQHRLAGGNEAATELMLPVVAFTDLSIEDQIKCFVTINKEQRGVSSSLYLELLSSLPGKRNQAEDAKERAVDLAHQLRQDEESPFYGRIVSTTSPQRGELSLTNFVRKIHPLLKPNARLAIFSDEKRCGIINAFYKALGQTFPEEYDATTSVFFKTVGFGALIGVLPTVIDIALGESHGFRVAHATRVLQRIGDFDFSPWRKMTGSGAEIALADELRKKLIGGVSGSPGDTEIDLD
jgi:DGQHR domain-containing protein